MRNWSRRPNRWLRGALSCGVAGPVSLPENSAGEVMCRIMDGVRRLVGGLLFLVVLVTRLTGEETDAKSPADPSEGVGDWAEKIISNIVGADGSSQTWDTDAAEPSAAEGASGDLGVDDRVGTGEGIGKDAAEAREEIRHMRGGFTVEATKSTWEYWIEDGYFFIEKRDEFQMKSPLLGDADRQIPRFRAKIGARVSFDGALYDVSGLNRDDFPNDFGLRGGHIYAVGEYLLIVPTAYKVQFGFTGDSFFLSDFFFRIQDRPLIGNIQFGKFKAPFSLGRLHSSWDYPLMEFASPVEAFAPGYKTGFQSDWYSEKARVLTAVGLFTDIGTNDIGDATDSLGRFQGRVAWRPWVRGEGGDREFVHLGLGLGYVFASDDGVHYRSRPESRWAPLLVDTGSIDAGTAAQVGLEGIWSRGSWTVMGEYIQSFLEENLTGNELSFSGGYISVHYILTGETWPYDPKVGTFRSLNPARPFGLREKGSGAWEISARVSTVDLDDGIVRGGQMDIGMIGLNWHWNKHTKWMLNVGYADVDRRSDKGHALIGQFRFQVRY